MSRKLKNSVPLVLLGAFCFLMATVEGCGPNPVLQGKAAQPARQAAQPAMSGGESPRQAALPGEQAADGVARPAAKTPLIRGLSELLDSNPALEDDTKNPLRDQLEQADDILSGVKNQNRAALRQVNRQQRLRRNNSPNIVLVIADDLGMAELNCYGHSKIKTPYLDQIAKLGTRFTQSYVGSPGTVAAHWCLATGQRPDAATNWSDADPVLQSEDITIAETMWQAGYTTALFGDWGLRGPQGPATPADQGFDEWVGAFGSLDRLQPFPVSVLSTGKPLQLSKNAAGMHGQRVQDFYVSEAAEFMTRHYKQRPMFLQVYLSVSGAAATPAELAAYADQAWDERSTARAAAITQFDQDLGKLLKKLDEIKQLANTVFIVTSARPCPLVAELPGSSTPPMVLRGGPGTLYEGGLRVPLVICGTRRIPAGQASPVVAAAWDLAPTIYELVAAQQRPARKAGQSLLPLIRGDAKPKSRFLNWGGQPGTPEIAARWQNWKAVRHAGRATFELYDLEADPTEKHDVGAAHPLVIAEILKRISPPTEQPTH